jgi:phosphomethylpyrimidine synthase
MNATDKALKNNIDQFIGKDAQLDVDALKPFANSKKIYIQGSTPDIQVPFREISISDTPSEFGAEKNAPVLVYDTSGPYTDPKYDINIQNGLPPLKTKWIEDRQDTEILDGPTSVYGQQRKMDHKSTARSSSCQIFPLCIYCT